MTSNKKKKIILISPEQQEAQVGSFFRELGIELSSNYDKVYHSNYLFIVDDYLADLKILPRIQTKNTISSECFPNVRAMIPSEYLDNSEVKTLLKYYFSDEEAFDLLSFFSRNFKNCYSFKIHDYLNVGYFIDSIIVKAYQHNFDFEQIRNYLNYTLPFALRQVEKGKNLTPVEVSFSCSEEGFAIQIDFSAPEFSMNEDFKNSDNGLNDFFSKSNYFDVNYYAKKKKLQISSLWFKNEKLKDFKSYFLTEIVRSNKRNNSSIVNILNEDADDTHYLSRDKESNSIKIIESCDVNTPSELVKVKGTRIVGDDELDVLHVKTTQNDIDKEILEKQILRMKIFISKMKDEMKRIQTEASGHAESQYMADENNTKEKIVFLKNELFTAIDNVKEKEKEVNLLKSQLELTINSNTAERENQNNRVRDLEEELPKNDKHENKQIIEELKEKNKTLNIELANFNRKYNLSIANLKTAENEESEKVEMEEKNKLLSLELKKAEHKIRFTLAKLDEALKSKNLKAGSKNNENHSKQLEIATAKINEALEEISVKKKENNKLKQENNKLKQENFTLSNRMIELERKLAINDKKIA